VRIGTKTDLKLRSFAVFESTRFVTMEQWSSLRTAFALLMSVSTSVTREYHPRYLNVSTCCSVFPLICRIHCLRPLERHNTSNCLVLIFVPAWSHAAENRPNACWRPCLEEPRMQYQFVRKKQTIHPAVPNSGTLVDESDCLSNSCRPGLSNFRRVPHKLLHNSSRAGHLAQCDFSGICPKWKFLSGSCSF